MIHPTSVIHPQAQIHPTVEVGPYTVIGENVKIGPETKIGAHVAIEGLTEIGARNRIFTGAIIGSEPQDFKYDGSESLTKIGDGNTIREYVTINRATHEGQATAIGNHNLLMAYVHVAHNCVIANHVVIANAVELAGHVHIESQAVIGGLVGVHQFVHVGKLAMVGGMSRIDRDVPPFMLVEGNPSRVRFLNQVGLKRAGLGKEDRDFLKKAFRILYRSGLPLKTALEQMDFAPSNEYIEHLVRFLKESSWNEKRRGPIPGRLHITSENSE